MISTISHNTSLQSILSTVRDSIAASRKILPHGSRTKPNLSACKDADILPLDMSNCSGLVEYQPDEFTITALAGTAIRDLVAELHQRGQYLPFDPLWCETGATLGGTVAAGATGPGRLLYGGLRDFIIGVQLIDGNGQLVRGGGKVVKNAAGFDLPKMMVGSLGRLGIITEVTLKVFPAPLGYRTVVLHNSGLRQALDRVSEIMLMPVDICAVELESDGSLKVRVAGDELTSQKLVHHIVEKLGTSQYANWFGADEHKYWHDSSHTIWADCASALVRVPLTVSQIVALDRDLERLGCVRRYSAAGNVAWIALPDAHLIERLSDLLCQHQLKGLVVRGDSPVMIGTDPAANFAKRIQRAIDPKGLFVSY